MRKCEQCATIVVHCYDSRATATIFIHSCLVSFIAASFIDLGPVGPKTLPSDINGMVLSRYSCSRGPLKLDSQPSRVLLRTPQIFPRLRRA